MLPNVFEPFRQLTIASNLRNAQTFRGYGILSLFVVALIPMVLSTFVNGSEFQQNFLVIGKFQDQSEVADKDKATLSDLLLILKERIDPEDQRGFRVRSLGNDQVEFTFPNASREEVERIWNRLTSRGTLRFRVVANENRHPSLVAKARKTTATGRAGVYHDDKNRNQIGQWVRLARQQQIGGSKMDQLPFQFMPSETHLLRNGETGKIISFDDSQFIDDEGEDRRPVFNEWCLNKEYYDVEILVQWPSSDRQDVQGKFLSRTERGIDESGNPRLEFQLNPRGAKRLFSLTSKNAPHSGVHNELGLVFDNQLVAAPQITSAIKTEFVIEGKYTVQEIDDMVAILKSGELAVPLQEDWIRITEIDLASDQ